VCRRQREGVASIDPPSGVSSAVKRVAKEGGRSEEKNLSHLDGSGKPHQVGETCKKKKGKKGGGLRGRRKTK